MDKRLKLIATGLALADPPIEDALRCILCGVDIFGDSERPPASDLAEPKQHAESCPWRLAREWLDAQS